ncbi:formimidoylglutamate deiminase [Actinokineospora pegani]|uniref:formimidoylglutamate deiminase n=1 Tax=Actinokineospora pegani TaxID=2654637 RepID=UPI0012EAD276|nr:formimidoylglutamate deiminase [Actinokineospora pegani]
MTARYWAPWAWLPSGIEEGVLLEVAGGVLESSRRGSPDGAISLPGLVLPGIANAHSHAFHRVLRGRTHGDGGTFWTWRERMYELAARLDPDSYFRLARAVYAEMALAGYTAVGEFHYLHHSASGPYDDPNAMGQALIAAAGEAGVRLTLLDACYLAGGIGEPLSPVQRRFSDGTAQAWLDRVSVLESPQMARTGAAIHSVRAVPRGDLAVVAQFDGPLHVHVSEQPAENEACLAAYGRTPTQLLHEAGALGPRTTAVHATHLAPADLVLIDNACFCPTTEGDLADGHGPARELLDAGARLSIGSDQHAVVDPFAEVRALEHGERFRSGTRGRLSPQELVTAMTTAGYASLGWQGGLVPGAVADFVSVRMDSVRTAGSLPEQAVLSASASDVDTVVIGGRVVVRGGEHVLGDVGRLLADAISQVWT